ncbi:hypothetical protein TNIN_169631 [Trichonephila inaurata madagascariensis]|uniref:Uncharacterized protein n=1 Tax=Trichonephila inaurata madagascariensis TaxID=2747483 RepID=A0A8X6WZB3_9ARAC|nr:hypothetical protein TNIN_169631 [Trichonephila inaurata madagascariensis]
MGNSPDTHNIKLKLNRLQNTIKRKVGLTDNRYGRITYFLRCRRRLWGTAKAFRKKRQFRSQPLMAQNGTASATQTKTGFNCKIRLRFHL